MAETILVTGAQGFLGRWVVAALADLPDVTVVGAGRSPHLPGHHTFTVSRGADQVRAPLPPGLAERVAASPYHRADLTSATDVRDLLDEVRPTTVVHAAAALRDEAAPALLAANVAATATLVEAVGSRPGTTLVLISSGSVYGATGGLPLDETMACHPVDPYAVTKLAAEQLAWVLAGRAGVRLWTARVFNLVGPGLQERHLPASLAAQLTAVAVGAAPPVLRLGDTSATRDLVDVRDAADAVAVLARTPPPVAATSVAAVEEARGLVNVASGRETAIGDVVDGVIGEVRAQRGLADLEFERLPPRPADIPRSVADTQRMRALGWAPTRKLGASLGDLVTYYLDDVWR